MKAGLFSFLSLLFDPAIVMNFFDRSTDLLCFALPCFVYWNNSARTVLRQSEPAEVASASYQAESVGHVTLPQSEQTHLAHKLFTVARQTTPVCMKMH